MTPSVESFFDPESNTFSHVVWDTHTQAAAIIDSVYDFCAASGRAGTASADRIIAFVKSRQLNVCWILETHVHADHLSAARYLRRHLGGQIGIGRHIGCVQRTFADVFHTEAGFATDGSQFDHQFADGDTFSIGDLTGTVMHTPGHTPACVTYVFDGLAFVGDTLFMPDYGTARTDFPGGNARQLYHSIQRIFALPGETRLYLCHDYKVPGRDQFVCVTTVDDERQRNVQVHLGIGEEDFIRMRCDRDAQLAPPKLLLPAVQFNMRGGDFPPPESDGRRYLKIPVDSVAV